MGSGPVPAFKALRLGPVVAHPRRRAFPRAAPRPQRLRWPLPRCIRRLHLYVSVSLLLRAAALTGPTVPAAAAPLPSRLLHLHRSMPPLRPSIGLHLASFSRFIYATLAVFSISCVVYGFRRFPLPVLAVARHLLAACTKDEAGAGLRRWGASRGAERTAENASRPGVKVRWLVPACSR